MSEYIVDLSAHNANAAMASCDGIHQPIVRCRDCRFRHKNYCKKRISPIESPSEIFWIPIELSGFCAWGERRGDAE